AQGELLLEPCPVRRERRLALLELPADLLLALAEVPELRLHAFQALGRRFLAGAAILELDRDLVGGVPVLLGLQPHALQLGPQLLALRFQRLTPDLELLQGLRGLGAQTARLADLLLGRQPLLLDRIRFLGNRRAARVRLVQAEAHGVELRLRFGIFPEQGARVLLQVLALLLELREPCAPVLQQLLRAFPARPQLADLAGQPAHLVLARQDARPRVRVFRHPEPAAAQPDAIR